MLSIRGGNSSSSALRAGSSHGSVSALFLKASNVRHIGQQVVNPLMKQASCLIHAYMVCGLNKDPTQWLLAPKSTTGRPRRTPRGVGSFLSPQILGSIPARDRDEESVQILAAALEVCTALREQQYGLSETGGLPGRL